MSVSQPTNFRSARNLGAATIARYRLCTWNTTAENGVELANSATDAPRGVATEEMVQNGPATSVQTGGVADCVAGAAVAIGDRITSDSTGRGIPATSDSQSTWGTAVTAASGADVHFKLDLDYKVNQQGGIMVAELEIGHADLTDADGEQTFAFVTVPAGSVIYGYEFVLTESFVAGSQTLNADIGYATAETNIAADLDIDGSTTDTGAAVMRQYSVSRDIQVRVQSSGNVVNATAGAMTIRLFYAAA